MKYAGMRVLNQKIIEMHAGEDGGTSHHTQNFQGLAQAGNQRGQVREKPPEKRERRLCGD